MYIEKTSEYAVGELPKRRKRMIGRKREGRSPIVTITGLLGGSGLAVAGVSTMSTALATWGGLPFATFAFIMLSSLGVASWTTWPESRRDRILKMLWGDKLIDPDDVLYQLVLTDDVIAWLLAEKANGNPNGACKQAVDAFITEFAQYRDSYSKVRGAEDSELITEEWEAEHGPLFEHPLVLAIQDAICDNGDLQCHVYDTVMELREERRKKQEYACTMRIDKLTAEREELKKKLELTEAQLKDLDDFEQKCLTT